ncbi:hypothetical protein Tco_0890429 [Tanacetum coccineum]|uniref:Uncharacterized protein n=1 Tax=Tanacetum coccineum TaxID=301880 RepID=A0ABQ5C334_9ASTR
MGERVNHGFRFWSPRNQVVMNDLGISSIGTGCLYQSYRTKIADLHQDSGDHFKGPWDDVNMRTATHSNPNGRVKE